MRQAKFEIHMHSTFSDGEFSPAKLVEIARKNDVTILSLTDHDTFSGIEEFMAAGAAAGIFTFPGIEITVAYRDFNLHLLAYFKNLEAVSPVLRARVEGMRLEREQRMREIIERVEQALPERFRGMIAFENVKRAAEGVVARPHLGREMVKLGIVRDVNEAFDKYLIQHNIEKDNIAVEEAIRLIRASNGIPVVAHPGERFYSLYSPAQGRDYPAIQGMLEELKAVGLLGMECAYPYHERIGKAAFYFDLAEKVGLIATGSRDFHGYSYAQRADALGTTKMAPAFYPQFLKIWENGNAK